MAALGRRSEAAAASAMLAVVTPVLLALLTLLFQLVAWEQADQVAHLAARRAADAARLLGGTDAMGRQRATDTIALLGPDLLVAPSVSVTRSGVAVQARVSGHAVELIPWLHFTVSETAAGRIEEFSAP